MKPTPEQQKELAHFPAALRALIEAELAAGNSIVEVGHSFPAPPAGAYFKLANKISTRPRASGSGLDFYDRNSSIYSGEFTDAKRFYFVLEPPNPPPPDVDMDAIRRSLESENPAPPKLDMDALLKSLKSKPEPIVPVEPAPRSTTSLESRRSRIPKDRSAPGACPPGAYSSKEAGTRATRVLHFRDPRPPHEIQFVLERNLMTLFTIEPDKDRLTIGVTTDVNGAQYDFELRFEEALPRENCYSLKVDASWEKQAATHHDYYRKTSSSWFDFWTREFDAATPATRDEFSAARYQELCDEARRAEQHLDNVPAVQQAIVAALKRGSSFSSSYKEGGTTIFWRNGRFVRDDYGDSQGSRVFENEATFLIALRQFYDMETSRGRHSSKPSEFEAWKLILRLLRTD